MKDAEVTGQEKPDRPVSRSEMAKATVGALSLLVAVVCVGFGRMDAAGWFAIAAAAFGGSLYFGRRA